MWNWIYGKNSFYWIKKKMSESKINNREKSRLNNKMRLSQSEIDTRIDQWNSIKDEKGKTGRFPLCGTYHILKLEDLLKNMLT